MSDYIVKDGELEFIIETKQKKLKEELGRQYIRCRKEKKLTQQEIADMLGVKRPNITRFENGSYNPTVEMLVKMAECLGKELEIKLVDKVPEE